MHPDDRSQRRTAAALAGHTGDRATATAAVVDSDPAVRIAGVRSLARLSALTDSLLADALADGAGSVRIAALELAATRPAITIAHLLDDSDAMVVEATAWALGERPDASPAIIVKLTEVAGTHEDPLAREAAVAALGAIGDPVGLEAILTATRDKPAIRRRAVIALVAFEGPDVDAAWERARTDHDRQVREAVEELLGPVDDAG